MSDEPGPVTPAVIDLVIPARDEQENITALLEALPRGWLRHVIVVDNGSRDRTADLARAGSATVVSEPARGYGSACLAGIRWIESLDEQDAPLAVAFLDADLADDPGKLSDLVRPIIDGEADLVVGTRHHLAEPGALDPHQRFGNWLACRLIGIATGQHLTDLGPMRVLRWVSLQQLDMRDRTWGWMVEMTFKAARQRLRVVEIDVPYRRRRAGRSKISGSLIGSVRAGTRILVTIGRLWFHGAERRDSSRSPQ